MQFFFLIFFLQISIIVFSIKTEIKFNLNVPSLFRCKKNGPVFYFDNFPTDQLFNQTITNSTRDCDLSLISSEKRVIFDIKKHDLQCEFQWQKFENRVNEILFFKSNCSINDRNDLCIGFTPTTATIITDYVTESDKPISMDLRISGIGTENIQIGDEDQYPYPYSWTNDGYKKSGVRRYQIVFKMKHEGYLNMMCRYTYMNHPKDGNAVCRSRYILFKNSIQTRAGTTTSTGEGWSWLCYYYPSGVEKALDYGMITKAREDLEKANSAKLPILSILPLWNLTEFVDNSSISLNQTDKGSSTPIFVLLLGFMMAGGLFYIYKKQCQIKSKEFDGSTLRRSSLESQNSITSNDSMTNEDD